MVSKLISTLRSKLSGQTREQFGFGQRYPLTKQMMATIRRHTPALAKTDMSGYSFERRRSTRSDRKSDIVIYDERGQPVLNGTESQGGEMTFWPQ